MLAIHEPSSAARALMLGSRSLVEEDENTPEISLRGVNSLLYTLRRVG